MKAILLCSDRTIKLKDVEVNGEYIMIKDNVTGRPKSLFLRKLKRSPVKMFMDCLREDDTAEPVSLEDLLEEFRNYCIKRGLEPSDERFADELEKRVGDSRIMYINDNKLYNAVFEEPRDDRFLKKNSDVWFLEKGRIRKRRIPVFFVIEGTNCTQSFDTLMTVAENGRGEIVTIDDSYMAEIIGTALNIGASVSTYEKLEKVEKRSWYSLLMSAVTLIFTFMVIYLVYTLISKLGIV